MARWDLLGVPCVSLQKHFRYVQWIRKGDFNAKCFCSHTDRSEAWSWPRCYHMTLETLIYCLRGRNYFAPLSPEVGLCETCLSFPYSMLIGLPVASPGILFLAANLNMHLRFLFNLLKYDSDNIISTACTAPLISSISLTGCGFQAYDLGRGRDYSCCEILLCQGDMCVHVCGIAL